MAEALAEKIIQAGIKASLVAYCPTMDLIALVTVDGKINVYRLSGHKVFGISSKDPLANVTQIKWKPNGRCLAAACDEHSLSLTDTNTGNIVHRISCSDYSTSPICCLGWGINFADTSQMSAQVQSLPKGLTLDDVISHNPQVNSLDSTLDLPLDLRFLDVETLLPRLSTLSPGGVDLDVFSSRTSLESLFQPLNRGSTDTADVLLVGFADGTIHLRIYDVFEIGTFDLQQSLRTPGKCRPILHASHPYSTTHCILMSNSTNCQERLQLVPLDLRFISTTGRFLSLLASKATQLQNILRYIQQVQRQMYTDLKASQDLPRRFMGSLEESLQDSGDLSWQQAAYHLVVTGNCHPEVKDWLINQLGERGHKRWEKATVMGYESVRRLTHECLLPALERLTVVVSRLRGLSKFQFPGVMLGLLTRDLDNTIDTTNSLQLVAHHVLIASASELRQFKAFSVWLHEEVQNQTTDSSNVEAAEKDANFDYIMTLDYIEGAMKRSQLLSFFEIDPQSDHPGDWDLTAEGGSLFEIYQREITAGQQNELFAKRLPRLDGLIKHLSDQCTTIFNSIAETQRRNVRFGPPIDLATEISTCLDMRILALSPEELGRYVTYVIVGPTATQPGVFIYKVTVEIENGMSSTRLFERSVICADGLDIRDAKFVDDNDLLLAIAESGSSKILRIPYAALAENCNGLQYTTMSGSFGLSSDPAGTEQHPRPSVDLTDAKQLELYTWQQFPAGVSWTPQRLEVNGRKGRRVVCVVTEDGFHYRVYDLDASQSSVEDQDMEPEGL